MASCTNKHRYIYHKLKLNDDDDDTCTESI